MTDPEISALVTRLARAHPSGGIVIERTAILAAGADYPAIMKVDHRPQGHARDHRPNRSEPRGAPQTSRLEPH